MLKRFRYYTQKKNGKFFEMTSYLTNISQGQFHKLLKNNQILVEEGDIFVDAQYNEEVGLVLDIPEGSLFEERIV